MIKRLTSRIYASVPALLCLAASTAQSSPAPLEMLRAVVVAQDSGLASDVREWRESRKAVSRLITLARRQKIYDRAMVDEIALAVRTSPEFKSAVNSLALLAPKERSSALDSAIRDLHLFIGENFPESLSKFNTLVAWYHQLDR